MVKIEGGPNVFPRNNFWAVFVIVAALLLILGGASIFYQRDSFSRAQKLEADSGELFPGANSTEPQFAPDQILVKFKSSPAGVGSKMAVALSPNVFGLAESLPAGARIKTMKPVFPVSASEMKAAVLPSRLCSSEAALEPIESTPEPGAESGTAPPGEPESMDAVNPLIESGLTPEPMPEPTIVPDEQNYGTVEPVSGGAGLVKYLANILRLIFAQESTTSDSLPEPEFTPVPTAESLSPPVKSLSRCFSFNEALAGAGGEGLKKSARQAERQYGKKQQRLNQARKLEKQLGLDRWYVLSLDLPLSDQKTGTFLKEIVSPREAGLAMTKENSASGPAMTLLSSLRGDEIPAAISPSSLRITSVAEGDLAVTENEPSIVLPNNPLLNIIRQLSRNSNIESVQPNYIYNVAAWTPDDPFFSSSNSWGQGYDDLWGIKKIKADQVWDGNDSVTQGEGVVVAVIDTGIDYNHPDLAANIWINPGEDINGNGIADPEDFNGRDDDGNGYVDDVRGWDFAYNSSDPIDRYGHGTHVAGTIAAVANNGAGVVGVAPRTKLMAVKGLGDGGGGATDNLVAAVRYAADNGVQITNNSWGGLSGDEGDIALREVFDYSYDLGVLNIAAAGNSNQDIGRYVLGDYLPASYDTVMAVSATDENDVKVGFSNYGLKVDIAAPGGGSYESCSTWGCNILSAMADSSFLAQDRPALKVCQPAPSVCGEYYRFWGTSMASPHVAGAAALVLAQYPDFTPDEIRGVLEVSADPLTHPIEYIISRGRINPQSALATASTSFSYGWLEQPENKKWNGVVPLRGFTKGSGFSQRALYYTPYNYFNTFDYYQNPSIDWTFILGSARGPVEGNYRQPGVLGYFDTTTLDNGTYLLKLVVTGSDGRRVEYFASAYVENSKITSPVSNDIWRLGDRINIDGFIKSYYTYYDIEYGEGLNPASWSRDGIVKTKPNEGASAEGVLATWDTAGLSSLGSKFYTLRLTVDHLGGGMSVAHSYMVYLDSQLKAGWPRHLSYPMRAQTADLDGDGTKEIIALEASLDFNSPDLFKVVVFGVDGRLRWERQLAGSVAYNIATGEWALSPAIADIDGDGLMELAVVGSSRWPNDDFIYLLNYDGSDAAGSWPIRLYNASEPLIADLDGNGIKEIAIPYKVFRTIGGVFNVESWLAVIAKDGQVGRRVRLVDHNPQRQQVIIGNFDQDSDWELVVVAYTRETYGSAPKRLTAMNLDGSLLWSRDLKGWISLPPSVGDIDGDGFDEVVVGTINDPITGEAGKLYVLKRDGTNLFNWPVAVWPAAVGSGITGAAALANFDDDRQLEIAIPARTTMYLFDDDGSVIWSQPNGVFNIMWSSAYAADVNDDGTLDIVGSAGGFHPDLVRVGGSSTRTSGGIIAWDGATGSLIDLNPFSENYNLFRDGGAVGFSIGHDPDGIGGTAVVDDIDNDNLLELISYDILPYQWYSTDEMSKSGYGSKMKDRGALYVWELDGLPNTPPSAPWPMFIHDSQHTGNYDIRPRVPNLVTENFTVTGPLTSGSRLVLRADVKNIGSAAVPIQTTTVFKVDGARIVSSYTGPLAPNAMEQETGYWTAKPGIHIIEVCADGFNYVTESNESDNCSSQTVEILSPNLVTENFTITGNLVSGVRLTLRTAVRNISAVAAVSTVTVFKVDGVRVDHKYTGPLAPGAIEQETAYWTARSGTHTIEVCADGYNYITESNEQDNCSSQTVTIR